MLIVNECYVEKEEKEVELGVWKEQISGKLKTMSPLPSPSIRIWPMRILILLRSPSPFYNTALILV